MVIAYYFTIVLELGCLMVGPYPTHNECMSVEEWLTRRGYETETCAMASVPQDSVYIEVGYLPK